MKKAIALLTILALPALAQAVYVNYNLTPFSYIEYKYDVLSHQDEAITVTRDFYMGYYLMLIDSAFTKTQFLEALPEGSSGVDIANIPYSSILYQSSIYSATGGFAVDTTATSAYLALFTTDTFPVNDVYYTLYSVKSLTADSVTFEDNSVWVGNTTHLYNLQNSIPEPSSGLLALVGFSLLALKRKRRACVFG